MAGAGSGLKPGRTNYATKSKWEPIAGYSRAVRAGDYVHVCGSVALDEEGEIVAPNDPAAQTRQVLRNVEAVLARAGAELADVVRTRIFVTDISRWEEVAAVHGEVFADIRPATTMVEVSGLIASGLVVEIEADAWLGKPPAAEKES